MTVYDASTYTLAIQSLDPKRTICSKPARPPSATGGERM